MSEKALMPIEKKRSNALKRMTEAGQLLAHDMEALLAKEAVGHILTAYTLGERLVQAHADEPKYGNHFVRDLADYLVVPGGKQGLYNLMNFSRAFKKDYVKTQSSRVMANGGTLGVMHWMHLMKVENPADQQRLLDRVITKSLSTLALEDEIRNSGMRTKFTRQGGRKPSKPTSAIAGLHQFYKAANSFANLRENMEKLVFPRIEEMSNTQVSEILLDKLKIAFESVVRVQEAANEASVRLEKDLDRVRDLLKTKKDAPDVSANGDASIGKEKSEAKLSNKRSGKTRRRLAAAAAG